MLDVLGLETSFLVDFKAWGGLAVCNLFDFDSLESVSFFFLFDAIETLTTSLVSVFTRLAM